MSLEDIYFKIGNEAERIKWDIYDMIQNLTSDIEAKATILYIGIGVLAVLGIVIIVNQIKIKKMLRKLTEEQDKP